MPYSCTVSSLPASDRMAAPAGPARAGVSAGGTETAPATVGSTLSTRGQPTAVGRRKLPPSSTWARGRAPSGWTYIKNPGTSDSRQPYRLSSADSPGHPAATGAVATDLRGGREPVASTRPDRGERSGAPAAAGPPSGL